MKPSLYLGIDKSSSPESIQNQLRKKRSEVVQRLDASQLQKFDTLIQKPIAWDNLFAWGDRNGIWIGSREDFDEYNPVSESLVDKNGHMKPLSLKQKMIARMGGNRSKIDAPDFAALRAKRKGCTCGTSKGVCKKCATGEKNSTPPAKKYGMSMGGSMTPPPKKYGCGSMKTESQAQQVVNRLVGESDLDLMATSNPGMTAELMAGAKGMDHEHDETDMGNPEERTEVEIANEILDVIDNDEVDMDERHQMVRDLANELLAMHGQEDDDQGYDLGDGSGGDDDKGDGDFEEMPK
jgi:hypothetical protein